MISMKIIENMTEREDFLVSTLRHIQTFHHLEDDMDGFIENILRLTAEIPVKDNTGKINYIKGQIHEMYIKGEVPYRLVSLIDDLELEG